MRMDSPVRIITTGGTIDSEPYDPAAGWAINRTYVPKFLKQGRVLSAHTVEELFKKGSDELTEEDRLRICERCLSAPEDRIIVTHGTGTMEVTARYLGERISAKTVVLTGSMLLPHDLDSDIPFNLGFAFAAALLAERGVYVAMNGKLFSWNTVRKNREQNIFEEVA